MTKEIQFKLLKASLVASLILFIDQYSKIWIKTHFTLGESFKVTDWFYILFIENNGMAFGMEFFDKLFLSLFRIVAVIAIGYYVFYTIKKEYKFGYTVAVSMICSGAMVNIID